MYNVSADYKSQIKNTLRNPSYLKVEFSIVDPQAIGDASLSDNVAETHYSDLNRTTGSYDVTETYMTLEHNRFFLDGQNPLAPELDATEMLYQGFVGSTISDDDGIWSDSPKITINFLTTYFEFIGLTFSFDTVRNEFPEQFRLIAYKDAVEVYNVLVTPDTADMYVHEDNIPECNKIEIIPTKSTTPHRRFRFQNIIFGLIKIFDNDVVSTSKWTQEVDLINSKLPKNNFDFTIIDVNREYDPENPLGIYQYMESQQPINFKYGYELNDGSIEWVQGGNTFTTGEVDVKSEAVIPVVSFKTTSSISYLDAIYKEGKFTANNINIQNMISNGGFENGLTGYTLINGTAFSIETTIVKGGTNSVKIIPNNTNAYCDFPLSVVSGHMYYASAWRNRTSYEKGRVLFEFKANNVVVGRNNPLGTSNGWERASFITTTTYTGSTNTYLRIGGYGTDGNIFTAYYDDLIFIDLTETFGAGNEPSKEWCDANINYFDGTVSILYSTETLYSLAEKILTYSNLPLNSSGQNRWKLNDVLKNYYTTQPLPVNEIRVLLQLIANAGMCVLYIDRDGNIVIEPKDTTSTGFTFELGDVYTIPSTSKYPILKGVDTYSNTLTVRATAEEIGAFDIVGASNTLYEFDYNSTATNVVASAGAGLTIVGTPTYYANMCRVVLTGTGKLTINGKIIDVSKNVVSVEFNSTGDRCPIENSLITSRSHAVAYATWIGNYVNRRNEYEFEDRGFPELDCGDELALNTLFNEGVNGTLISAEITSNGTLKGKSKILKQ